MDLIIKQEEEADEMVRQHLVDNLVIKEEETDADMRARLVESLSASFPGCALTRTLQAINDEDLEKDPLSRSCYAELRLEKGRMELEEEDDELTNLGWLQDNDLLKNISTGDHSLCASPTDDVQKENVTVFGQTHPPHVPYNPQKHINSKPPYSFSCLIFMAIEDSPIKKLAVKDIYNWILTHFPYFRYAPTGWKNSVRHNLSLNKCFKKVEKEKGHGLGKGSLWCIDPMYRPNLLQALRKTPYHPYHQLQMLSNPQPSSMYTVHGVIQPGSRPLPLAPKLSINSPSPHLFPFLSKRLSQSGAGPDIGTLGDSDIDVANTLMSLKRAAESRRPLQCQNGARSRSPSPPEFGSKQEKELLRKKLRAQLPKKPVTCTAPPSEDHMYCVTAEAIKATKAALSPGSSSSIDEEYDFGNNEEDEDEEEEEEEEVNKVVERRRWSRRRKLDRSHSDIDCTDSSDLGSDGEHRSRVRGLVVRLPINRKRKRKASRPLPTYKKRLVDTDEEEEERKVVAGADALLNLASAALALRSHSPINSNASTHNNNNNDYDKPPLVIKESDASDSSP